MVINNIIISIWEGLKMKRVWLLLIILLFGCTEDQIRIGYSNTLTGVNASLGIETMYGAQLAVEMINESGGVNGKMLELVIEDDMGEPETAVMVDNKLNDMGVVAIIGHGLSKVSERVIKNANDNDFLIISPTIATNAWTGVDDNFIRLIPDTTNEGLALCEITLSREVENVMIISESDNSEYTMAVQNSLIGCLDNRVNISLLSYTAQNTEEYKTIAETIKNSNVELVIMITSSPEVINIEYTMNEYGISKDILMSEWGTNTDILIMGRNQEGSISGINYFYFNTENELFNEVSSRYLKMYGKEISFSALYGYEAVMVLYEALQNVEKYTTSNLKDYIVNREYMGTIDTFYIDEFGDNYRKCYELILIDGKFVA